MAFGSLPFRVWGQALIDATADAEATGGTVTVLNVYESELPWPDKTKITALRMINIFPKDNSVANEPAVGVAAQSLCRGVLGTVPVEADGSAHFRMPSGVSVYFQALDEQGLAVQTMRSATYLHAGENLTCIGCHEGKSRAARGGGSHRPLAVQRPPSTIEPEVEGSYPLTFPRLVQPVLDRKCVACHDQEKSKKAPCLRGDRFQKNGWSEAFQSLRKFAWGMSGGNGVALKEPQYSTPGRNGAQASQLYPLLVQGHYDVKLTPSELRRITLWLDCNSNFFGAYHKLDQQSHAEVVRPKLGVPPEIPFERLSR